MSIIYPNQLDYNRAYNIDNKANNELSAYLINYPEVRANGNNMLELECNLEDSFKSYLKNNNQKDFKTGEVILSLSKLYKKQGVKSESTLQCESCNFDYNISNLYDAPNGDLVCQDCMFEDDDLI